MCFSNRVANYGYFKIAKWLVNLSIQKNFIPINIHAQNEYAFRWSCEKGYLEIAKWLVELGVRINMNAKWISTVRLNNEMTEWLQKMINYNASNS